MSNMSSIYHEYFVQYSRPMLFAKINSQLNLAKLNFVCSARYTNFQHQELPILRALQITTN
jgi:hypothetical protein